MSYIQDANNVMEEQKAGFVVSGYVFDNEETAKKAEKEIAGVAYIKNKLDMQDPEAVLSVYNRVVKDKMFSTPVGYEYLTELVEFLGQFDSIDKDRILPIGFEPKIVREDSKEEPSKEVLEKKEEKNKEAAGGDRIDRLRGGLVTSLIVNVILVLAIVAMFILVSKSDVPTIIDYENKLIDRYEEWQKSLEEREAIIRDYEEKYNIDNGFTAH